jgi:geranylgeranyl pyrophosphate synthase
VGRFCESVGEAFQLVDDVLNLRGFEGNLKTKGEDIRNGKVTAIIARAMGLLPAGDRRRLWEVLQSRAVDEDDLAWSIELLESCGALDACDHQARLLVEQAWDQLDPLIPDSIAKLTLRVSSEHVLRRLY